MNSDPGPKIKRILMMIPLLRQRPGISIKELCKIVGASRKAVLADLNRIFLCGVPPYLPHDYIMVSRDGENISVDFADHFSRPVSLTLREALALKVAIETLPPLSEELGKAADALLVNVNRLIRKNKMTDNIDISRLDGTIAVTRSEQLANRLKQLGEMLAERREIVIDYRSATATTPGRRSIRPYALVDQGGNYYLISYCLKSAAIRCFRVDRIVSVVEQLDSHYEIPEDFDLIDACQRIRGIHEHGFRVKVKFAADVSRWILEDYPDDELERQDDGSLIVTFTSHSISWAVDKILGYGELATVLEPAAVREAIVAELATLAA